MGEANSAAVVLLSGGMDSTVLLHHVVKDLAHHPVYALSYDYGQRHAKELDCAAAQASAVGVAEHRVVHLPFLPGLVASGTALVDGGSDVPDLDDLDEEDLDQPPTYVPNRNMVLLSIAAAYAETLGAGCVYYGAQAHDEYGYWDCTADFVASLNRVLALNRRDRVEIRAPFSEKKKSDLVTMGQLLEVDFSRTWSCYRGLDLACGTCPTCVERRSAFAGAGHADPLAYES